MTKRYLIDANVFIQGKNFHYNFAFCIGFWKWVEEAHKNGSIFSIKKVKSELTNGKKEDEARIWAEKMPAGFFLDDVNDQKVMSAYGDVMKWMSQDAHYTLSAKATFSDDKKADAFLLAYAKAHDYTIVTQEVSNLNKKSGIPIPDAAIKIGNIKTMPIYQLLARHAKDTFVYQP